MLNATDIPELALLHRGKVRDSYRVDATTRLIVVTDRLSAFDYVLDTRIAQKGEVLAKLSAYWFRKAEALVPTHFLTPVGSQSMLVREAQPIRVEMVVRGYISGSMWRGYKAGKRTFSGVTVGDGLTENARLPAPIVTPTTKEESDVEITPAQIVACGLATRAVYEQMVSAALALFAMGSATMALRGLILADTKLEFGLVGQQVVVIDEMLTPDSSRIWDAASYARDATTAYAHDKEYVRAWLRQKKDEIGSYPNKLEPSVALETQRRYLNSLEAITGEKVALFTPDENESMAAAASANHVRAALRAHPLTHSLFLTDSQ